MTGTPLDLGILLGASLLGSKKADAPRVERADGSFQDHLSKLVGGGDRGLPTAASVKDGLELDLSPEQLQRLGAAADKAMDSGLLHALVEIDGRTLVMDVTKRQVIDEVDGAASVVRGVDGFVRAESVAEPDAAALLRSLGAGGN